MMLILICVLLIASAALGYLLAILPFAKRKKQQTISKELTDKDPLDFTLTKYSTPWQIDKRHCTKCKASVGHTEFMSEVCNTCGSFNCMDRMGRSYREIFIGGQWKYQIKYRNGDMEIIDKWYHSK